MGGNFCLYPFFYESDNAPIMKTVIQTKSKDKKGVALLVYVTNAIGEWCLFFFHFYLLHDLGLRLALILFLSRVPLPCCYAPTFPADLSQRNKSSCLLSKVSLSNQKSTAPLSHILLPWNVQPRKERGGHLSRLERLSPQTNKASFFLCYTHCQVRKVNWQG